MIRYLKLSGCAMTVLAAIGLMLIPTGTMAADKEIKEFAGRVFIIAWISEDKKREFTGIPLT